jgi:hypothetical protein
MGLENPQRLSVIDPIGQAIEHVRLMLFRPFDLSKWLIVGFCAWLAQLGQGGGGGGGGNGWRADGHEPGFHAIKEGILANLAVIIFVAAIVIPIIIIIAVALCWLRSRGQFMFVHCVAGNKAEVAVPWNKFARHGNSLFLFRIVIGLIFLLVVGLPVAVAVFAGIAISATGFNPAIIFGLTGAIFVAVVIFVLFALVAKFTTDFVVPIMSLHTESCVAGWKQCLALISGNKAQIALYILFQIVISLAIGFIAMAVCLVTCCCCCCLLVLFVLPYVGTVILLPLIAFKRAYSLFYLRQFGAQFDVFSVQSA